MERKLRSNEQANNKRTKNLNNIFTLLRNNKFNRDKLDYELSLTLSSNTLKNLQNNKNLKKDLRSKTYDTLNLHIGNTLLEAGLASFCRKDPSFVPVPPSCNWLQRQINVDSF